MADDRSASADDELVDHFRDAKGRVWLLLEESDNRARVVTPAGRIDWRDPEQLGELESKPLASCGATDAQVAAYGEWIAARDRELTERELADAGVVINGLYTPDEGFKARVFELLGSLTGYEAMVRASEEYGITLSPSYYTVPHSHIHRWRTRRRSA